MLSKEAPGLCCNLGAYKRVDGHFYFMIMSFDVPEQLSGASIAWVLYTIVHCCHKKIPDELFVSDHDM